jgi:hypothetical protein
MKALTIRHLEILEYVEIDEFLNKTVADMIKLNISAAYPKGKDEYKRFTKIAFKKSEKYGLKTEAECFSFVMAWHVLGKELCTLEWLTKIIKSKNNTSSEKKEALMVATYEALDKRENM